MPFGNALIVSQIPESGGNCFTIFRELTKGYTKYGGLLRRYSNAGINTL